MIEISLGPIGSFESFPSEVLVEGAPYWLVREGEEEYRLLLALCPHAGGEVRWTGEVFFCPLHLWTFDGSSGACLNMQDERLVRRDAVLRDGILYAVSEAY